jgi:hypothetical protein
VLTVGVVVLAVVMALVVGYVMASPTFGWTGERRTVRCRRSLRQSSVC